MILAARSGRGADVDVRYDGPERGAGRRRRGAAAPSRLEPGAQRDPGERARRRGDGARLGDAHDGEHSLAITDRGNGIPAEARDRLFDAFFTTRSHGMGIGLAVVKRIVDDHGFAIEVDSEEGNGTTFRVRISGAARAKAETASARAVERHRRLTSGSRGRSCIEKSLHIKPQRRIRQETHATWIDGDARLRTFTRSGRWLGRVGIRRGSRSSAVRFVTIIPRPNDAPATRRTTPTRRNVEAVRGAEDRGVKASILPASAAASRLLVETRVDRNRAVDTVE